MNSSSSLSYISDHRLITLDSFPKGGEYFSPKAAPRVASSVISSPRISIRRIGADVSIVTLSTGMLRQEPLVNILIQEE